MICRILILLSLLLVGCSEEQTDTATSFDGRFGRKCPTFDDDKELCIVTVTKLAVNPERYHNRRVRFSGSISLEFENQRITDGSHSVWLDLNPEQLEKARSEKQLIGVVQGIFNANFAGQNVGDGAIHSIEVLF